MSQAKETFFTSVGCMDGRVQEPVLAFGQKKFGVEYADTITEAGLVGLLAKNDVDPILLDSIKKKILISLEKHHSRGIVVHGHEECAGNPVDDEQHKKDTLKSAEVTAALIQKDIPIIPVFVRRSSSARRRSPEGDSGWIVEEL